MTHDDIPSSPIPLEPGLPSVNPAPSPLRGRLSVFEFTDYRKYLLAFYEGKKAANGSYTMSSFVRRAGLGANSRGYLKLVIEGKRSLTPHTLRRFIEAMDMKGREALYFENLVYFNQSKTAKDRDYYFHRLSASTSAKGPAKPIELLKSQYDYFSNWYYPAIREVVALGDFKEDPAWIAAKLKNKITRKNAADALAALIRIGMVVRTASGKLVQSEPAVTYSGGTFNAAGNKLHAEVIDRAALALREDADEDVITNFVTLSVEESKFAELKQMIEAFRERLTTKFGLAPGTPEAVLQVNLQLFYLTRKQEKPE
jgi:uncharacterized protein (TIGR02147 family)